MTKVIASECNERSNLNLCNCRCSYSGIIRVKDISQPCFFFTEILGLKPKFGFSFKGQRVAILGAKRSQFAWYAADYAYDAYVAYEGEVVGVRRPWMERFILESSDDEHLVIRTPSGRTIDRTVPRQHLVLQGIGIGDYVVKERGFGNRVRRRGPGTAKE